MEHLRSHTTRIARKDKRPGSQELTASPLKRIKHSESPACTQLAPLFASSPRPPAQSSKDVPLQTDTAKLRGHDTGGGSTENEPESEPEPKINAQDRVTFEIRWDLVRPREHFHLHTRTKRSVGENMISWIFMHGIELSERVPSSNKDRFWLCKLCHDKGLARRPFKATSTSSAAYHLLRAHRLTPKGPLTEQSQSIVKHMTRLQTEPKREERWREAFLEWLAHDNPSLEQASSERLHKVIILGGPEVENLLPRRNTMRNWILGAYHERQKDVIQRLQSSISKITLSMDIWSAPNDLGMLGIVAHRIDEHRCARRSLIGLRELPEGHAGSEWAPVVAEVIDQYCIGDKLGYFQMDNAANNDTALRAVSQRFVIEEHEQRLRCFGHVVNLVVKALLFGEGLTRFTKDLKDASDFHAFRIWRSKGAIGKLHNLVVYITRSNQRVQAFNRAQSDAADDLLVFYLRLKKDTGIRWNSIYTMIERALVLEDALRLFGSRWSGSKAGERGDTGFSKEDILDTHDWQELRHFKVLLEPFYLVTKRVEGHASAGTHGAIWEVLPAFELLYRKLKRAQDETVADPEIYTDYYKHSINAAFVKLSEYYNLTDRSRVYRAAVALHPGLRFAYFERVWKDSPDGHGEIKRAKAATKLFFKAYLAKHPTSITPSISVSSEPVQRRSPTDEDWEAVFGVEGDPALLPGQTHHREQELDTFMEDYIDIRGYESKPLTWWKEVGEARYPTLARVAYDLFAVPGMSAECERAFSRAKKMVTEERHSLRADIIEAEQCLKSWLISGIVDGAQTWASLQELNDDQAH